jgi:hypothetical protein
MSLFQEVNLNLFEKAATKILCNKKNHMLKALGVLINLGTLAYLGFKATSCMGTEQIAGLNTMQNPWILSFVGVVSLFIVLKY